MIITEIHGTPTSTKPDIHKIGSNTIPEQHLTYANQLTVRDWNIIINSLRSQTNGIADYLRQLSLWLTNEENVIIEEINEINSQLPVGTSKIIYGPTIPTVSTVGTIGQLYIYTGDKPTIYQCQGSVNGLYNWQAFSADVGLVIPHVSATAPETEKKIIWFDTSESDVQPDDDQEILDVVEETTSNGITTLTFGSSNTSASDLVFGDGSNNQIQQTQQIQQNGLTFGNSNTSANNLVFSGTSNNQSQQNGLAFGNSNTSVEDLIFGN